MQPKAETKSLNLLGLLAALKLTVLPFAGVFLSIVQNPTESTAAVAPASAKIQIRISSTPQVLDWNKSTSGSEGAILQNMMEGLMALDHNFQAIPLLAEKVSISPDGKIYTFQIKKGLKWTDQKELIADHFVDSIERLLNTETASRNASLLFTVKGAREFHYGKFKSFKDVGVKVIHPHEFTVELTEPFTPFPLAFTHWATFPIRKEFVPGPKSPTIGPFQFQSMDKNSVVLKKNPKWRNASKMPFQQAIFRVFTEGKKALEAFKNKKLDFLLQLEDELLQQGKAMGGQIRFVQPTRVSVVLLPNPNRQSLNSPEKRRALFKMIKTLNFIQDSNSTREAATTVLPNSILGFAKNWKAKPTDSDSSFLFPDEPMVVGHTKDDFLSSEIAEILAKKLNGRTEAIPPGVESGGNYGNLKRVDLFVKIFGLVFLDPDQMYSAFLYQGPNDLYGWSHPEYNRQVTQARQTVDAKTRSKMYEKAEDILQNEAAIAFPLFYRRRAYMVSSQIVELNDEPAGSALVRNLSLKLQ